MEKPKIAFFDFASCEGCQIELTNYGSEDFLELLNHVEICEFREAMSETTDHIDIAFVEGAFTRESDRARLEDIRKRSTTVIAYGACATTAGITALKNHQQDYKEFVYGEEDAARKHLDSTFAKPVSAAIKVDYSVHGCPIDRNELLRLVTDLLHGNQPYIPNYPVCVECKRRETVCRYDVGDYCMGMVARAGCNAPCPADGIPCEACRGFIDDANRAALKQVLMEQGGLTEKRAEEKSRMFTANLRRDRPW